MRKLLLLLLFCLPSWGGWSYYYPLTYDHTQVGASDSPSFPALVSFNASAMKDASHGGDVQSTAGTDILFFSDSGLATQIPSELDSYDNVNGIGWFWVQIATLSHSTNGTIYMAVGNASPPARTTGVWDANFEGVWHLKETATGSAGDFKDSSGNANVNVNTSGEPTAVAGKIGVAQSFNGSSQFLDMGSGNSLALQVFTYEAWINPATLSGEQTIYSQGYVWGGGPKLKLNLQLDADGVAGIAVSTSGVSSGLWSHVALSYGLSGSYAFYINGSPVGSGTALHTFNTSGDAFVGAAYSTSGPLNAYFNGQIQEVHISNMVRSPDWIAAEYHNQNAPGNIGSAAFWTFGAKTGAAIARRRTIVVQ